MPVLQEEVLPQDQARSAEFYVELGSSAMRDIFAAADLAHADYLATLSADQRQAILDADAYLASADAQDMALNTMLGGAQTSTDHQDKLHVSNEAWNKVEMSGVWAAIAAQQQMMDYISASAERTAQPDSSSKAAKSTSSKKKDRSNSQRPSTDWLALLGLTSGSDKGGFGIQL